MMVKALLGILLLPFWFDADGQQSKKSKPNVIVILADDLGLKDLSCTGSQYYETPNIDRLASEGMVFRQGYATSGVCSPSRASIMTGKFTATHGITDWIGALTGKEWLSQGRPSKVLPADYVRQLPKEDVTIAEAFSQAGYKTFFAGKWHLGNEGSYPQDHGFDINKGGWEAGGPKGGYFSPYLNPNLVDGPDGENLSMRLAQETATFIDANRDHPFFAFLSFYAVHGSIETTQEKWKKYRDKAVAQGVKEKGFEMEKALPIRITQDNPVYAGLVETMDDAIGVVLKKLDELNLTKNTIIVFTSDNGGVSSGDSYSTSNLPYRGGKGYQWEGGMREPYFIKVPSINLKEKFTDYPATGADLFPTLLDLAGLNLLPQQHVDGVSLKPILEGRSLPERPLYWHYPHYGNQGGSPSSIVRQGKWKLIHYWEDGHFELYDLTSDPFESKDLTQSNLKQAKKLNKQLLNWLDQHHARYPTPNEKYNEAEAMRWYEKMKTEFIQKKETERLNMLKPDYKPNADWWGSAAVRKRKE